jgi:hypothetical protein
MELKPRFRKGPLITALAVLLPTGFNLIHGWRRHSSIMSVHWVLFSMALVVTVASFFVSGELSRIANPN